MAITFDHAVKYNGKYYPPNTPIEEPVPVEESNADAAQEAAQEAADAAQEPAEVEAEATAVEEVEAPEKATKRRKKGDA